MAAASSPLSSGGRRPGDRHDNGGRTAAVLTSFITTCKRLGIDPFAYLRDIFERITTHPENRVAELLPDK
jgi:transposase